ncbi:uncharacterized protein LOC129593451 isoform X2 [Paramacrobiotus metropolitanus]|uniref:uncharacterized protein LOC129593451 isoform X2 n=1 Tax=Paramacrobiotus metropolitanus TaxID=2943436 RepID=UPI0024456F8D|nr:uncharacterized protein LOC129593451 isoform X2 [Paramacrobiotus metropolitanus]
MEDNLAACEQLLNNLKQRFPISDVQEAAELVLFLLHTEDEPNLTILSLLLSLTKKALAGPRAEARKGSSKRIARSEQFVPVEWDTIWNLWLAFRTILTSDSENFKRWRTKRTGSDSSTQSSASTGEADVIGIYRFITRLVTINQSSGSHASGSLIKFIEAVRDDRTRGTKGVRSDLDLSEIKQVAVIIAQLLGMKDVHLNLSEIMVFLGVGLPNEKGSGLIGIPEMEEDFLPRGSAIKSGNFHNGILTIKDLWIYSKGRFVHCDRFMECAYFCCALQSSYTDGGFDQQLASFQRLILSDLCMSGKIDNYPMALTIYGTLERLTKGPNNAESILLQAVHANQLMYDNAFVFPYCFLMEYYLAMGNFLCALVPAHLSAKAAAQYAYHGSLDGMLEKELHTIAFNLGKVVDKTAYLKHPCIASLILAFMDELCLWEEKSKVPILHSLWSRALSAEESPVLPQYMDRMLASLRNYHGEVERAMDGEEMPLPEGLQVDEEFCSFALRMYHKWPPFRAFNTRYIDSKKELIRLPEHTEENRERYEMMLEQFKQWPTPPMISEDDLRRMEPIRAVNPLYLKCHGHVLPFQDMGFGDTAVYCLDLKKMAEEIMVPQLGTVENQIVAVLQKKLAAFQRKRHSSGLETKLYSEILLKSRKMRSMRAMLTVEKFSANGIQLQLEAGDTAPGRDRRERKPTARYDL